MDFNTLLATIFITFLFIYALTMALRGIFKMFFYTTKDDFDIGVDFRQYD
jgi:hypothetical protein